MEITAEQLQKEREAIDAEKSKIAQEKADFEKMKTEEKFKAEKEIQTKEIEKLKAELESKNRKGPTGVVSTGELPPEPSNDIDAMFKKRMKTTRRFPNREDLWHMAPRQVNPDGDIGLGEALMIQKENFSRVKSILPLESQGRLGPGADIHISAPPKD